MEDGLLKTAVKGKARPTGDWQNERLRFDSLLTIQACENKKLKNKIAHLALVEPYKAYIGVD